MSDPISLGVEYFSAAERTIALDFAGDCDDYAIVLASLIEAIGGRTRIMVGYCAEGGHAWPEVFVGNRSDGQRALRTLGELGYRNVALTSDSQGAHWLSLDWILGQFTCGDNRRPIYTTRIQF